MRHGRVFAPASLVIAIVALGGCGSDTPTVSPTPRPTATPTPTPTPTPAGIVLPTGMTCSPTPPPLLRMQIGIHSDDGGRVILDSKPLVANVDDYCHRVGLGSGKFCDTRPEGHAERVACDYLATGIAKDTGRWGPTWIGEGQALRRRVQQLRQPPGQPVLGHRQGQGGVPGLRGG